MSTRLIVGTVLTGTVLLVPLSALAAPSGPVPATCLVVNAAPVHAQVGYAPNGPSDCTVLPAG